ncbi:MAG: hydrogen gas-evolving membrane-bound hydrogenase subunit E [Cyclobacteriaceae bacterium]
MLAAVLSAYFLALLCLLFFRRAPHVFPYLVSLLVAGLAAYFFSFWGAIGYDRPMSFEYAWVPSLNLNLVFYLDGLSLFFALLITTFGTIILFYSSGYMKGEPHAHRFFAYLLIFMASMLGLVLSGNIIQIYVFWELTSISSFLLIAYKSHEEKARKAAVQALLVTAGGGLALLAGLILIAMAADSYSLAEILQSPLQDSPYLTAILLLVLLGCFTKSAQFPFHFWLPNAMAAPTPVSAYLHSATMVKAGIYLLLRLNPVFMEVEAWSLALILVGTLSMMMGAAIALVKYDLKKILAYITISTLGLIIAAIGIGTEEAVKAGLVYLFAHALYKGAMFMIAGNVDHEAGTKDIRQLGGLGRKMPFTATAAVLASLSMAGAPPLIGFIGKEKLYEASVHAPWLEWLLTTAFFLSSVLYVCIAIIFAYQVFFGQRQEESYQKAHRPHFSMWIGPLLLGAAGLFFGIFNHRLAHELLSPAVSSVLGEAKELELKLWHGFNLVLLLSLFTLFTGYLVYLKKNGARKLFSFTGKDYAFSPEALYEKALVGLDKLALAQTRLIQSGYLRNYLTNIIAFFTLCLAYLYFSGGAFPDELPDTAPISTYRVYEFIPLVLIAIGFYMIFTTRSRLTMLISAGMLGFGVASIFIFFSAPDVSITQFLAETVTLLIFMLIIHRLPKNKLLGNVPRRLLQLTVSLGFGLMMTLVLLSVESESAASPFKEFYLEQSIPLGKGQNVVNVILVDFRALDTWGEITVLCIAALGIVALNQLNLKKEEK